MEWQIGGDGVIPGLTVRRNLTPIMLPSGGMEMDATESIRGFITGASGRKISRRWMRFTKMSVTARLKRKTKKSMTERKEERELQPSPFGIVVVPPITLPFLPLLSFLYHNSAALTRKWNSASQMRGFIF